jgi:hypothetical protein
MRPQRNEAELVAVGGTRALIVVPRRLFTEWRQYPAAA